MILSNRVAMHMPADSLMLINPSPRPKNHHHSLFSLIVVEIVYGGCAAQANGRPITLCQYITFDPHGSQRNNTRKHRREPQLRPIKINHEELCVPGKRARLTVCDKFNNNNNKRNDSRVVDAAKSAKWKAHSSDGHHLGYSYVCVCVVISTGSASTTAIFDTQEQWDGRLLAANAVRWREKEP